MRPINNASATILTKNLSFRTFLEHGIVGDPVVVGVGIHFHGTRPWIKIDGNLITIDELVIKLDYSNTNV